MQNIEESIFYQPVKLLRKHRHRVYIGRFTLYYRTLTRSQCRLLYAMTSASLECGYSGSDSAMLFSERTFSIEIFQLADCLSREAKASWKHNKKR